MIKVLFLIHDLGQGGAEKVLVNLVNNMDRNRFDVTVMSLFGGGINEQFLSPKVHYKTVFSRNIPANSQILKLFSPAFLHRMFIKDSFDVEISYLEGPSARIISGCKNKKTKLISWIHVEQHTLKTLAQAFRSVKESVECYNRFDQTICVSECVKKDFSHLISFVKPCSVLYNTVESERIVALSHEDAPEIDYSVFSIISVGTLKSVKGHDRLIQITKSLNEEGYSCHLYILGKGPEKNNLLRMIEENALQDTVTMLGYRTNPYKYVRNANLFVCASYAEGFSTAATEALIVGTPVCTVEVSGMKEMLGEHNEYGIVVSNDNQQLRNAIREFIINPQYYDYYKQAAQNRGLSFQTAGTVHAVEKMIYEVISRK